MVEPGVRDAPRDDVDRRPGVRLTPDVAEIAPPPAGAWQPDQPSPASPSSWTFANPDRSRAAAGRCRDRSAALRASAGIEDGFLAPYRVRRAADTRTPVSLAMEGHDWTPHPSPSIAMLRSHNPAASAASSACATVLRNRRLA